MHLNGTICLGENECPYGNSINNWKRMGTRSSTLSKFRKCFFTFPGLKIVVPSTAKDCKGLMAASIFDKNPVVFIEHRWLHYYSSNFSKKFYKIDLNNSIDVKKRGRDLTILSSSIMLIESLKAAKILKNII